ERGELGQSGRAVRGYEVTPQPHRPLHPPFTGGCAVSGRDARDGRDGRDTRDDSRDRIVVVPIPTSVLLHPLSFILSHTHAPPHRPASLQRGSVPSATA